MDDLALLREYADSGSEEAFRELVARHLATVYSAARRQVGEPLAADVTQAVFILLARKAGKLRANTILTAWLLTTTRLVSRSTRRSEMRRQHREQEAAHMPRHDESTQVQSAWEQVQPALDDALAALPESDRRLVALRFFEKKSHAEIAAKMGVTEDASKKRLSRAVERLRIFFARGGITLPAATLLAAISENAVQAAPAGLAPQVWSAVSGAGGGAVSALVVATLRVIRWSRIRIAAAGAGVLAIVTVPVLVLLLSRDSGINAAAEPAVETAAQEAQPATAVVTEIVMPPSLDPTVVRGRDGQLVKLERYEFQAAAVQYNFPPTNPVLRATLSPQFRGERLLSAAFSWQAGMNFPDVGGMSLAAADEFGNEFDPVVIDMNVQGGQDRRYWVAELPVFPRRGKEVRLRLLSDRSLLAEFKIPNPAPGPHPIWNADPLPVRVVDRELEVSLVQFRTYPVSRETSRATHVYSRTECFFNVRENDQETTSWLPAGLEISDATGNHWAPGGGGRNSDRVNVENGLIRTEFPGALWAAEPAWKLRVEFKRSTGFSDRELLEIPHIRIPDVHEVSEPNTPYEWNGASLTLAGVCGTDVERDRERTQKVLINSERKNGSITVILRGQVPSRGRQLTFVSATDDQGRRLELAAFGGPIEARQEKFPIPYSFIFDPPKGAREVNMVVAVSEPRFLEFIARPEQVAE